ARAPVRACPRPSRGSFATLASLAEQGPLSPWSSRGHRLTRAGDLGDSVDERIRVRFGRELGALDHDVVATPPLSIDVVRRARLHLDAALEKRKPEVPATRLGRECEAVEERPVVRDPATRDRREPLREAVRARDACP